MKIDILKKLMFTQGVTGREKAVAAVIREIAAPYADGIKSDALGNLIVLKKGSSPEPKKLMFAAHMDEIGFTVTFIEEKGWLRVSNIGGISWAAAAYSQVTLPSGAKGVLVPESGVGAGDYKADKFVVDIGAKDRKEAEKKAKVGDFFSVNPSLTRLGGRRYAGRPVDDRIGCAVLLEVFMTAPSFANDTYFVFTVQEEVTGSGAKTASFGIAPDYAVCCDVCGTGDTVGATPMAVKLGGGCTVKVKDGSVICDPEFSDLLRAEAKAGGIKYQDEVLVGGGTDTRDMQTAGLGCPAAAVSIPTRYIHTAVETFDLGDVEAAVSLLSRLCARKLD